MGIHAPIAETTEAQFDDLMNVHLKGVFFLTQKLLPLLADGGRIVNVSSGLARFAMPGYAAYAAMKGGVEVLSRYLAKELGSRGIAVNVVAPGAIETDFGGGAVRDNAQVNQMIAAQTALGRVGRPDDVGGVVASLLVAGEPLDQRRSASRCRAASTSRARAAASAPRRSRYASRPFHSRGATDRRRARGPPRSRRSTTWLDAAPISLVRRNGSGVPGSARERVGHRAGAVKLAREGGRARDRRARGGSRRCRGARCRPRYEAPADPARRGASRSGRDAETRSGRSARRPGTRWTSHRPRRRARFGRECAMPHRDRNSTGCEHGVRRGRGVARPHRPSASSSAHRSARRRCGGRSTSVTMAPLFDPRFGTPSPRRRPCLVHRRRSGERAAKRQALLPSNAVLEADVVAFGRFDDARILAPPGHSHACAGSRRGEAPRLGLEVEADPARARARGRCARYPSSVPTWSSARTKQRGSGSRRA